MSLRYISTAEAAKILGVSTNTMRDLLNDPDGPKSHDVGRLGRPRLRVEESELRRWMETRKRDIPSAS